jgi:solute carrier family 35 protein F5
MVSTRHDLADILVAQNRELTSNPQLNSISSFISDMAWGYAMLLTTPLVVTVGLSLTIPLSLIGEMIQYSQYSSWVYWLGAAIVFFSFLFINKESSDDEPPKEQRTADT